MSKDLFKLDTDLEELKELEKKQLSSDDNNEIPPDDIVAFNELRSCADLVRMFKENQLVIQPDFQREIVWSPIMQTRLIDSLVKQLPIPSLCISLDYKSQERYVIDGLQRVASIVKFLDINKTNEWTLSKLDDIDERISGKSNLYIKNRQTNLFNKIENTVIPITVLRCNYSKENHMEYLFTIFHRLNSGGSKLTNQEIRNCIFNGTFNQFLKDATQYENFRKLMNLNDDKIDRFANQELILRFISFTYKFEEYTGKLSKFLNDFMKKFRNPSTQDMTKFSEIFKRTIDLIYIKILNKNKLPALSKATTEAIFVGVARNIEKLENSTSEELEQKFESLRRDELFSLNSLKEGLAQKDKVKKRLQRSIEIFG